MKKFGFATIAASGLAAAVLGLAAPAGAAPSSVGNAQDTVNQLQAQGYHVIVNRAGNTPLDQSSVVAVRHGQVYRGADTSTPGGILMNEISEKTVYVDVK